MVEDDRDMMKTCLVYHAICQHPHPHSRETVSLVAKGVDTKQSDPYGQQRTSGGLVGERSGMEVTSRRKARDVDARGIVDLVAVERDLPLQQRVPKRNPEPRQQIVERRHIRAACMAAVCVRDVRASVTSDHADLQSGFFPMC